MALGPRIDVVAVVGSSEMGAALNETCADMNGTRVDVHVGRLADVRPGVDIFNSLDVLLLEVDPRNEDDVAALQAIVHERFPKTPVVVTTADATLQDVRQLMRLGVIDVVPQPIAATDLAAALEFAARSKSTDDDGEEHGKIIAVLKAGGGVGATTLTVQAGHLMAQRFKGEQPQVCVLDFDLQYGNAALYMDLDNRVGLMDLVGSPERLDVSLLRSVMGRHDSGLDVLAAPRDLLPLETVSIDFVDRCLKVAARDYRYVFIDMPSVWTEWTRRVLETSDMILVVTQLMVANVRQARRLVDSLVANGLGDVPTKVVVNRFEKGWGKSVPLKQAQSGLGRPVDFRILNDYQTVSEAVNQGVPLSKVARRTKVEKSIRRMLDEVVKELSGGELRVAPRLKFGFGR